jgi:hypothetical protein
MAHANRDGNGCLTAAKLVQESEKHIYCESYFGFYVLFFLCKVRSKVKGKLPLTGGEKHGAGYSYY